MGNRGAVFLLGAAASSWLIYDVATTAAAPSLPLAVMKYILIAILLITTVYSGAMWLTHPPPPPPKPQARPPGRQRVRKRKAAR